MTAPGPNPSDPGAPITYRAFLSYSHTDTEWATWLMGRLENYRVPRRLQGRPAPIGVVGPRITPVFRDRDELPTTSDLGETIRSALAVSATLIVICSPQAAKSRWVQEEIVAFKRLHGERRVFAFIVAGEPREGAADDCFSPALRTEVGADGKLSGRPAEIVAADARPHGDGREVALVRLLAGLLGTRFDDLRQREQQRRYRRMTIITTGSLLGMGLTLSLASFAWQARNDARLRQEQAEDLLTFMVRDLRAPLAKLNRLDVLDAVGEKALAYFAKVNPDSLSDTELQRRAQVLWQIGENNKDLARYPEALRSLEAAFASAAVLTARHPKDGEMIFQRAQAEYWIGFIHRRLGRIKEATEWLTRYRDSGATLVALDPKEPRWQEELASGHHNLAVLDLDEERLESARQGFLGALAMRAKLAAANPANLELQFNVADVNSWLGNVAEMNGDFREAAARYAEQVTRTEAILRAEPDNPTFKRRFADALALLSTIHALTGNRQASLDTRLKAVALLESLATGDPKNQSWQRLLLWWRVKVAELLRAQGDLPGALKLADEMRERFEKLIATETNDARVLDRMVFVCRLQSELQAKLGRASAAEAAARAVELAERLLALRQNYMSVHESAHAHLAAGRIAQRNGNAGAAQQHWRRALELLEPRLAGSNHWRILFPAAHAYQLLGRPEASGPLVERLRRLGFQPLDPWP